MEEASSPTQKQADASVKKTKIFFLVGLGITAIVTAVVSGYLVAKSEIKTFEEKVRYNGITGEVLTMDASI